MAVFETGNPQQILRREQSQSPRGQVDSLQFIDRAGGRPSLVPAVIGQTGRAMGLLLKGHSGTFFHPGSTRRTVPRLQMSNRSGREFQQPVAVSGNQGSITINYQPTFEVHRELTQVDQLEAYYLIRAFTAPPFMNCVAGEFLYIGATGQGASAEEGEVIEISMLDQYGAVYVPGQMYRLKERSTSGPTITCTMEVIPGSDKVRLQADLTDIGTGDVTVTLNTQSGLINASFPEVTSGDFTSTNSTSDIAVLIHSPGIGYSLSPNLDDHDFSVNTATTVETSSLFANAFDEAPGAALYMGLYATPQKGLLYR